MLIDDFNELTELNKTIESLIQLLNNTGAGDDSYSSLVDQLTKLTKIKQIIVDTKLKDFDAEEKANEFRVGQALKEKEHDNNLELKHRDLLQRQTEHDETYALRKRELDSKDVEAAKPDRVTKDALVAAGASILGIALIINYERLNVIASKALGFVLKR